MASSNSRVRRAALQFAVLEQREMPAIISTVGVTFSPTGTMSLSNDDHDSGVTLKVESNQVTVTPDATTDIGFGPGVPNTFSKTVTALKADMKGGNDAISIDGGFDFKLTGSASFSLGDGDNTVDLTTTTHAVELGSLSIKAADGSDTIKLVPGTALGVVTGATTMDLGSGLALVTLNETTFSGPTGVKVGVTAAGAVVLNTTNVTVAKTLTLKQGNTAGGETLTGGSFGGLTGSGRFTDITLNGTTVNGKVKSTGGYVARVFVNNATVTGDITLTASAVAGVGSTGGTFTGNNITVTSHDTAIVGFANAATSTTTINGNVSVSAKLEAAVAFNGTGASEVKGNLSIRGGNFFNSFAVDELFKADKDVSLTYGDGTNVMTFGASAASSAAVLGKLTIKGGKGVDTVTFKNAAVSGITNIQLGAGADQLFVDLGSSFAGTFTADMGSGDDLVSMAQASGATTQVNFTAKATIKTGLGNDTLVLGKVTGGDSNSKVNFLVTGSKIDGGTGVNSFDDGVEMNYSGLTFGTSIVNFVDPA